VARGRREKKPANAELDSHCVKNREFAFDLARLLLGFLPFGSSAGLGVRTPKTVRAMIFVSYAHEDRARVKALVDCLEKSGLDVVWDHEVWAKDGIRDGIEREIARAVRVVVVWTKESVRSRWVRAEADLAAESGKLLQVRLDRVRLPLPFGEYKWFDLLAWSEASDHRDTEFLELLEELETVPELAGAIRFSDEAKRVLTDRREQSRKRRRVFQALAAALVATLVVATAFAVPNIWPPERQPETGGTGLVTTGGSGNSATGGADVETAGRSSQGGNAGSGVSGSGGAPAPGTGGGGGSGSVSRVCCHVTGSKKLCSKPHCSQCGLEECPSP
jgi:hypothetical protein